VHYMMLCVLSGTSLKITELSMAAAPLRSLALWQFLKRQIRYIQLYFRTPPLA